MLNDSFWHLLFLQMSWRWLHYHMQNYFKQSRRRPTPFKQYLLWKSQKLGTGQNKAIISETDARRKKTEVRLITSCKSWIWDQHLRTIMNWKCMWTFWLCFYFQLRASPHPNQFQLAGCSFHISLASYTWYLACTHISFKSRWFHLSSRKNE